MAHLQLWRLLLLSSIWSTAEAQALGGAVPRRTTAVNVQFSVGGATSATNVDVLAGVRYETFNIFATSGLGELRDEIAVLLVPSNMLNLGTSCTDYIGNALMGAPFDGSFGQVTVTDTARTQFAEEAGITFPRAGLFKLCYTSDPTATLWQELDPFITVFGSEFSDNRIWCALTTLRTSRCNVQGQPLPVGCECKAKIEGYKRNNVTNELMDLGLPNPAWPEWRLTLTESVDGCGNGEVGYFTNRVSEVENFVGYEVHNLGQRVTNFALDLYVWTVCYCAGYDQDSGDATNDIITPCLTAQDFPQTIGKLIIIDTSTQAPGGSGAVAVYPTLRWSLQIRCGGDGELGHPTGGCSESNAVRYRIIRHTADNYLNYFETEAGCRFIPQAVTTLDGAKIQGGQIAPANCIAPAECSDAPEVVSSLMPTFENLQMDASYENSLMVAESFDICYCDGTCQNNMNWFLAGSFTVQTVRAFLSLDTLDLDDAEEYIVQTDYMVVLEGLGQGGSFSTTGTNTRKMKILKDPSGSIAKDDCLEQPQPAAVSGHRVDDTTEPRMEDQAGQPIRLIYGEVEGIVPGNPVPQRQPGIKLLDAGWYAVCYCDYFCNEAPNWAVYGRVMIAGPDPGQEWVRYEKVSFSIEMTGWGLTARNQLLILSDSNDPTDCGVVDGTVDVNGPDDLAVLRSSSSGDGVPIDLIRNTELGVELVFQTAHELQDGDYIRLENIDAGDKSGMYNTIHQVSVRDAFTVRIPIMFPQGEFITPSLPFSVRWSRNSRATFTNIKARDFSRDGRGYVVCWSPGERNPEDAVFTDFKGQAGTITVKVNPDMREARLGLTSTLVGSRAPMIIAFETNDVARYEQVTGTMKLVIEFQLGEQNGNFLAGLIPKNIALGDLSLALPDTLATARQDTCGQMFLELWSEAPDGFPTPEGCYYTIDRVDPQRNLHQLHIVFSPRNHLQRLTKYMIVVNAEVQEALSTIFPQEGAVFIWSMDDVTTDPYGVVELGMASPQPQNRVPPRDQLGNLLLVAPVDGGGGKFDPDNGFRIAANSAGNLNELTRFCLASDSRFPDITPAELDQCKPCSEESDCGPHDASLTWCISPQDPLCEGQAPQYWTEAFRVTLRAEAGPAVQEPYKIEQGAILRIFLHPLTQWSIGGTCGVRVQHCEAAGGPCSADAACESQSVVGGTVAESGEEWNDFNVLKITLPSIMDDLEDTKYLTFSVDSLSLPEGGFFPTTFTAELMKPLDNNAPDYWPWGKIAQDDVEGAGARMYYQPWMIAASIVVNGIDGNQQRFRDDRGNTLYVRLVSGTTLYANAGQDIVMNFDLPSVSGYDCAMQTVGPRFDELFVNRNNFPSTQGRLGGGTPEVTYANIPFPASCEASFQQDMVMYARSVVFIELTVNNPDVALLRDDTLNRWTLRVEHAGSGKTMKEMTLSGTGDYWGSVSVLGKLTQGIIQPTVFGRSQVNVLQVFLKTEQEVGTLADPTAFIYVDAPVGFDFGLSGQPYCTASQLPESYYIPEPSEVTQPLPVQSDRGITCNAAVTSFEVSTTGPWNRAIIRTSSRMLRNAIYGFQLEVTNTHDFISSQLDQWSLWTYMNSGAGVDGLPMTAQFNPQVTPAVGTSWGVFHHSLPLGNIQVSIANTQPYSSSGMATDITFLPIIVVASSDTAVRVTAPEGYVWDFAQSEFRYKAPAAGVPEEQSVPGAEEDLPISGAPAKPIAEPLNRLAMDYMRAPWRPGVRYGFIAKIRVPDIWPTASANHFSVEFGYNAAESGRIQAGIAMAPLVLRLTKCAVDYSNNIANSQGFVTFGVETLTPIPAMGGVVVTGPTGFVFPELCLPKPLTGFPEMPHDSTCQFRSSPSSSEVSITAGLSGIPAQYYRFRIGPVQNPRDPVLQANAGTWTFRTFSVVAERDTLDAPTSVTGFPINREMLGAKVFNAPKVPCTFYTPEEQAQLGIPYFSLCHYEDWQFHFPYGLRDDRPSAASNVIFMFSLQNTVTEAGEMVIRAPEGYVFNTECIPIVTDSTRVFNDVNTDGVVPSGYAYAQWPGLVEVSDCLGVNNIATLQITAGLTRDNQYIFRMPILRNPEQTPDPNTFILQYNGESSLPLEGVQIWAFRDGVIVPTRTSSSSQLQSTQNPITFDLRPVNDIPVGGHILVEAPSGFVIPTFCQVTATVGDPAEVPNITLLDITQAREVQRWSEALDTELMCRGDASPVGGSNRARLVLEGDPENARSKYLKADKLYVFRLTVLNPQTITDDADHWFFRSYDGRRRTTGPVVRPEDEIIDSASIPGFAINPLVEQFDYLVPSSFNALERQQLTFNMTFPVDVTIGDTVDIVAPVSVLFGRRGSSRCYNYIFLQGFLQRTAPSCEANQMRWSLEEEVVPANTYMVFMVEVTNPSETPPATINYFQVRQTKPGGVQASSAKIPGYAIIPQFISNTIQMTYLAGVSSPCRLGVEHLTGEACVAQGSLSTLLITFTPGRAANIVTLSGKVDQVTPLGVVEYPFDFSQAQLTSTFTASVTARTSTLITMSMQVGPPLVVQFHLTAVQNPTVSGRALLTMTTYQDTVSPATRVEQNKDKYHFDIFGYIDVFATSSVVPFYFNSPLATVTFELECAFDLAVGDVLRITRPPGWTVYGEMFVSFLTIQAEESGTDVQLRFGSSDIDNSEDVYIVVANSIPANTRMLFSIRADTPTIPQLVEWWNFRTYKVLPLVDPADGEILDTSRVPYPWIDRALEQTGSNDGVFGGFLLVSDIPNLQFIPERMTPGAHITLTMRFGLRARVSATDEVRMVVEGPEGFVFDDSCLMVGSAQFAKCTGFENTATLTTVLSYLEGSEIIVQFGVTNPPRTPSQNQWIARIFEDNDPQFQNFQQVDGYLLTAMSVSFKGNNQLAEQAEGFFTFSPVQDGSSPILFVRVRPPANAGYRLVCELVVPMSLGGFSTCTSGDVNAEMELRFNNATVVKNTAYTFGVGILNPGGAPATAANRWGILLVDQQRRVFDGNLDVPGLELRSMPIRVISFGWTTSQPRVLAKVQFQLQFLYELPAARISRIIFTAPDGIMYLERTNGGDLVRVSPQRLPFSVAQPPEIAGELLTMTMDDGSSIPAAFYNLKFEISNPGSDPVDNTWTIRIYDGVDLEFSHVLTGYTQGQVSPFEVVDGDDSARGAASRQCGGGPQRWLAVFLLIATSSILQGMLVAVQV